MKDWRGVEIEVGSIVVYPVMASSSVTMNEAIVTEIGMQETWRGAEPVLIVQKTIEHTWRHIGNSECSKAVKLTRVDRVTVIA